MSEAIDILDKHKSLAARRDQWRPLWQELAEIFLPNQARFTAPLQPGREARREIYDTTPMQARRGLATAIEGLLKPSTTRWFWMTAGEDLDDLDEVKLWFEDVQNRMWRAIYNPRARFIETSGAVDSDLATFGLGHLWISENSARDGLTFKSLFIGDVAFDENSDGVIDTYTITRRYTARQARQRFGDDIPAKVEEDLKNPARSGSVPKTFEFVQCIKPREEYDPRKEDQSNRPFASIIVSVEDQETVEEGGFSELPVSTPRWDISPGDIYPRSPAMIALPDARTLQAMGHTLLVGGQRAVDPPIWIADDGVLSAVRTFPGGLTVVDAEVVRQTNGRPMGHLDVGSNVPVGREMQQDYRGMVEAAFFKNVFNLPIEGREMTATEVMERKEEFLRTIGPVMGQLESSYIGHTVERVFGIMLRAGVLPPIPEALQGRGVTFEFMSPIQQARKQIEAAALARSLEFIAPLGAIDPSVYDNFDADEIARDLPDMFSTPQKWLKPRDEVRGIRQQRARAMEVAQGMQGLDQLAGTGKTISEGVKNAAQAEQAAG